MSLPWRSPLWRMRLIHMLSAGAGGVLFPFITLFYERNGLSGTEIGLLGTVSALVALAAAPYWGRWSDRAAHPRRLLQLAFLGTALCTMALGRQTAFVWIAVIIALDALAGAGIEPLLSMLTLSVTDNEKSGFGSVRLWGSLGWALSAPLAGWLIEHYGIGVIFWGFAALTALGIMILFGVRPHRPLRQPQDGAPPDIRALIGALGRDRAMIGLGIALFVGWLTSHGRYQFEAIYLNQLGAAEGLIGLVNTVGALIELPAMLWADRLVRRRGSASVLKWGFLLEGLALVIVLAVPSVPSFFLFRLGAGVAYSFHVVALVVFVAERAPNAQGATTMALYMVTLRAVVNIVAGPVSGLVFDLIGAYWLFVLAFGGSLAAWLTLRLTVTGRRSRVGAAPTDRPPTGWPGQTE